MLEVHRLPLEPPPQGMIKLEIQLLWTLQWCLVDQLLLDLPCHFQDLDRWNQFKLLPNADLPRKILFLSLNLMRIKSSERSWMTAKCTKLIQLTSVVRNVGNQSSWTKCSGIKQDTSHPDHPGPIPWSSCWKRNLSQSRLWLGLGQNWWRRAWIQTWLGSSLSLGASKPTGDSTDNTEINRDVKARIPTFVWK